jgi:hypothetical protein
MAWINKFKGTNKYCMTCSKACKQFENVKVVTCPNRVNIRVTDPLTDKHEEIVG